MKNKDNKPSLVSVIILNYNGRKVIEECLEALLNNTYKNYEIIIVDNASKDNSLELAKKVIELFPRKKIIRNKKNLFFAEGNNIGIEHSNGDYVVVLNNDVVVEGNFIYEVVKAFEDETVGACQPKVMLYNDPERIDNAGNFIDSFGYSQGRGRGEADEGQYDNKKDILFAGGAVMALRKTILDEIGSFDSKFYAYCEDLDLSWRIRLKGYKIRLISEAKVYHHVGAVTSEEIKNIEVKNNLSFHFRKNRLTTLIKNYSLLNLFLCLPVTLFIYIGIFFKEIILNKNFRLAITSVLAVFWNIKELPNIWRERIKIQSNIRNVSDNEITKLMLKMPVVLQELKRCSL